MVKFFFDARLQCKNDVFFSFLQFERDINLLASKEDAKKGWLNFSSMLDYSVKMMYFSHSDVLKEVSAFWLQRQVS